MSPLQRTIRLTLTSIAAALFTLAGCAQRTTDVTTATASSTAESAACSGNCAGCSSSKANATRTPQAPATLTPAPIAHAADPATITSNDGEYSLSFTTDPAPIPLNDLFEIDATVTTASGAALPADTELRVDAAMPAHNHGMNTRPKVSRADDGSYQARGLLFHMSGDWVIYFDITRDGVTSRAQVEVTLE